MRAHEFADQGAAGIILYAQDTGRYGLQQRSDSINDGGLWAAWGGGREPGESLEQCARRELGEESGYTGPIKLTRLAENPRYVTFIGVVPHEFEPRPDPEWKDFCWVEAGNWPSPMHPGVAAALKNIPVNESADNTQWLYHATYRPLLKSIKAHGLGGDQAQAKWEDSKPGVVYLATDPNVAESYAESSDAVPEHWLDEIVILKIAADKLDQSRLFVDQNVQDNTGDTLEYHGVIPVGGLSLLENFADGKVKGKSRPGRVKRAGASCAGSVTDLRAKARKYGGERGKMYHWCANMKGGKK